MYLLPAGGTAQPMELAMMGLAGQLPPGSTNEGPGAEGTLLAANTSTLVQKGLCGLPTPQALTACTACPAGQSGWPVSPYTC